MTQAEQDEELRERHVCQRTCIRYVLLVKRHTYRCDDNAVWRWIRVDLIELARGYGSKV